MDTDESARSSRDAAWGIWEAGAIAVLFALPAAIHVSALHWAGRTHLDKFEWLALVVAIAAAFALSLYANGLACARAFLSVGLVACCAWTFGGVTVARGTGIDTTYFLLAVAVFTTQLNLVPVAVVLVARRAEAALGRKLDRPVRRAVALCIASIAALDLFPLVYLSAPPSKCGTIAVAWIAVTATLAGVFAGIAARAMPRPPQSVAHTSMPRA